MLIMVGLRPMLCVSAVRAHGTQLVYLATCAGFDSPP